MVDTLLSVDPGKRDAGVAFFVAGQLAEATWLAPPNDPLPFDVAKQVAMWARRCMMNLGDSEGRVSTLIVEGQQIYGRGNPATSNELLYLAQLVGGVLARVDHFEHRIVLPRVWTGGVPKPVRQRRFLSQCTDRERAMIEAIKPANKRHNAIDAITMGAWYLGRLRAPTFKDGIQ
jgi:hypothetical protein